MNVNTLKLNGDGYPEILRKIPDAPGQLYWLGAPPPELLNRPKIAVVGSRKYSTYGRQVTQDFTAKLAQAGVLIISGLALGIDSIAHKATLDAGGLTVAVLPTSLDNTYPRSHRQLAEDILKRGGALVSEYRQGVEAFPANFIARNRIISGLADGLLITEAAAASGTMHTARFALEQGKSVMAVPGNINNRTSEGCNNLIKAGATPVTSTEDIFFTLKIKPKTELKRIFRGSEQEQLIFNLIVEGRAAQEELETHSGLEASQLSTALTMLEINGYIKPLGGGQWAAA